MSLIWMDGFDSYGPDISVGDTGFFAIGGSEVAMASLMQTSGYVTVIGARTTTDTRTGLGKSMVIAGPGGGNIKYVRWATSPLSELYMGFAYKFCPGSLSPIVEFVFDDRLGHLTPQLSLYVNAEGGISIATRPDMFAAPSVLKAASPPNLMFASSWQYVEIHYVPNKTSGSISVKIDGQTCVTYTGPTSASTTPNQVNLINWSTIWSAAVDGYYGSIWLDDLYICDTAGMGFNSFQGDVVVNSLKVVSDQGPNDLGQYGGTTGHFTSVSEWPADGDTSYLYGNTVTNRELFGIDTLPANIINVLAMSVHVRARKDTPGASAVKCLAKYSTNETLGPAKPLGVQYVTKDMFMETCPDGTGWTKIKAQATNVGFEVD